MVAPRETIVAVAFGLLLGTAAGTGWLPTHISFGSDMAAAFWGRMGKRFWPGIGDYDHQRRRHHDHDWHDRRNDDEDDDDDGDDEDDDSREGGRGDGGGGGGGRGAGGRDGGGGGAGGGGGSGAGGRDGGGGGVGGGGGDAGGGGGRGAGEFRGEWELVSANSGVSAMHLQLMPNNKMIMFDATNFGPSAVKLSPEDCRRDVNFQTNDCWAHAVEYDIFTNRIRPLKVPINDIYILLKRVCNIYSLIMCRASTTNT